MKRYGSLYPQIYDFENLYRAYCQARKNKRYKDSVIRFGMNLEESLIEIQNELIWHTYEPGEFTEFMIHEPKERAIRALPFRDRVVQHALVNVIEPIFERSMIYDSYGCRVGKGMHRGSDRLMQWLQEAHHNWPETYVLKADISKFFNSIDVRVFWDIIKRRIKCNDTLWLIRKILLHGTDESLIGLPIGNLTSQLFANVYLDQLDHFVKERLHIHYYVRYMDDFVILLPDKQKLHRIKDEIEDFLNCRLHLRFNRKTSIFPARNGVDFLGYRTWATHRLVRKSSIKRMKRKLRHYGKLLSEGRVDANDITRSVRSWIAHVEHANTYHLRRKVLVVKRHS